MEQQRVLLAIALSIGVLLIWQYFFAPPPPEPAPKDKPGVAAPADPSAPASPGPANAAASPAPAVKAIPERDLPWDNKAFQATFTNKGGRLKSYVLKTPEQYAPRQDLLLPQPEEDEQGKITQDYAGREYLKFLPLATSFSGRSLQLPEDALYEVTQEGPDAITFLYTDPQGSFSVEKRYTHTPDHPHAFDLTVTVKNLRAEGSLDDELQLISYIQNIEQDGGFLSMGYLSYLAEAICLADGSVERAPADDATDRPRFTQSVQWAGVSSRYFMLASVPRDGAAACAFDFVQNQFLRTSLSSEGFRLEPGASRQWRFTNYVGPKEVDAMAAFNVEMEDAIDFGIFAFLCKPIHWLLVLFHSWSGNWGLAIIILTVFLRGLTFPINHKSYKNMEGMRRIQAPLKELQEKYKDDQLRMQQEMMNLYKKENVSPLGCLPTLLQIPIFFALYRTIYSSVELYQADFYGWYTDLSAPDPYYVLPVLVGAVMMGQQFLMPTTGMENPQMKVMMWLMPLMFSVFTFVMPSGLALYMFVSITLGIAQQAYIRKSVGSTPTTPSPEILAP
jgi:YidC/Oxa1 family membrane protein insertase